MVREQFHQLLDGDAAWEPGMKKLVRGTFEFVEFLDKVLKVDFSSFKLPEPQTDRPTTTPATSAASA